MTAPLVLESVQPEPLSPRRVAAQFRAILDRGAELRPVGDAREDPEGFLERGYLPRFRVELFDTLFFLTQLRFDDSISFFVAYVAPLEGGEPTVLHPRIFYKDPSLSWRVGTHLVRYDDEHWIGKGEVKLEVVGGEEIWRTAEETTTLPLEIQAALDLLSRRTKKPLRDDDAVGLVLRCAKRERMEPFADFTRPRRQARARGAIHDGEVIAYFERPGDPRSLKFVRGFEPHFGRVIDTAHSASRLYGGAITKYRILSRNGLVQFQFVAGPRHVWMNPPQPLTTELTTFGVRALDVEIDEDAICPGYEYHYIDDTLDPPELHTQIPKGYAGEVSELDDSRADASPWLDRLPVIRRFRKHFL